MDTTAFLNNNLIPVRLAAIDKDGFPVICSLWFIYQDGELLCASHASAKIIRVLKENPHCAFEVSINSVPYKGVRGKAIANLKSDADGAVLSQLIARYLGDSQPKLSKWLLSRRKDEYAIHLKITSQSSWDFSERMQGN
ncbi:pyridoxamine 5'-phosphate oxidase family protein [Zhongshania sp.]|uniref:pyridoxamine 5'-phosphate oxidase family protein n=1 Tax=Zhongshania sp. TaxID=1971902 RepID=UPI00356744FF